MQQAANSKEVHLEAPCTCTVADLSMAKASFNGRLTAHHHLVFEVRGMCLSAALQIRLDAHEYTQTNEKEFQHSGAIQNNKLMRNPGGSLQLCICNVYGTSHATGCVQACLLQTFETRMCLWTLVAFNSGHAPSRTQPQARQRRIRIICIPNPPTSAAK